MDLVADSGLGLPAEFLGSARGRAARQLTDRDEKVLALLQQASLEGAEEIVLTEALIADLQTDSDGEILPAPWAEVSFEIRAPSPDAVAAGAFGIALTGIPRPGSSMAGRFAHLLPAEDQAALTTAYAATEPGTIAAQLSFPPRRRRNENIARTSAAPAVRDQPRRTPAPERERHRARRPRRHRGHPCLPSRSAVHRPPNRAARPARPRSRHPHPTAGPLPRRGHHRSLRRPQGLRLRRSRPPSLLTARPLQADHPHSYGLLQADDLPSRTATTADWESGLRAWRTRLRAPERIVLVEQDQRLPLDLTHPVHRVLLRTRLDGARRLELRETSDPAGRAWIGHLNSCSSWLSTRPVPPTTCRPQRPRPRAAHTFPAPVRSCTPDFTPTPTGTTRS